jgi:hypothetical protein
MVGFRLLQQIRSCGYIGSTPALHGRHISIPRMLMRGPEQQHILMEKLKRFISEALILFCLP